MTAPEIRLPDRSHPVTKKVVEAVQEGRAALVWEPRRAGYWWMTSNAEKVWPRPWILAVLYTDAQGEELQRQKEAVEDLWRISWSTS
jgi:hypothetical protein